MIGYVLKKVFGTKANRDARRMRPLIDRINQFEASYASLGESEFKNKTAEFKARVAAGESIDSLMCEAFAAVKHACRRKIGRAHV